MGHVVVLEVHGQAVVDHDPVEAGEHIGVVGGVLAPGRTGEEVGVELVRGHVEPPLVGAYLVRGLVGVDERLCSQACADLVDEAVEPACRLLANEATNPVDTLAPSMADSASAVRSTGMCWAWSK